ncbi:unnamed protein product [Mytilus edulis]|uniref:Uncharacterized protein n=1 Tax=Mytilus edulis TaxID=6550 RepID=A0A8S3UMV5_MYTED|nr:unnamed protein product [Mytilus edulis]
MSDESDSEIEFNMDKRETVEKNNEDSALNTTKQGQGDIESAFNNNVRDDMARQRNTVETERNFEGEQGVSSNKFDIVECTDFSITIEWFVDVLDECISYELDHRPQGTNDWSTETFLSGDVLKGEDGQRIYQLQNHYLKPPRKFDIVECTDCSITIEWFIDVQDECLSYELDHRPQKMHQAFAQDQASVKTNLPVSVTLRQQFYIKESINEYRTITSCIKINNTLVFTDLFNMSLIICNGNGTNIHHMPLSHTPWFITELESNTVAVSITILIIDISTDTVTRTIKTSGYCYGISYTCNDNNLYVVINRSIIHVMDLTGKVIRTIPLPSDSIHDITVDRDRLVCTDFRSIYCCSLDGKLIWNFKKDKSQDLRRVTTDDEQKYM